jgi:hypothetical protein
VLAHQPLVLAAEAALVVLEGATLKFGVGAILLLLLLRVFLPMVEMVERVAQAALALPILAVVEVAAQPDPEGSFRLFTKEHRQTSMPRMFLPTAAPSVLVERQVVQVRAQAPSVVVVKPVSSSGRRSKGDND